MSNLVFQFFLLYKFSHTVGLVATTGLVATWGNGNEGERELDHDHTLRFVCVSW